MIKDCIGSTNVATSSAIGALIFSGGICCCCCWTGSNELGTWIFEVCNVFIVGVCVGGGTVVFVVVFSVIVFPSVFRGQTPNISTKILSYVIYTTTKN